MSYSCGRKISILLKYLSYLHMNGVKYIKYIFYIFNRMNEIFSPFSFVGLAVQHLGSCSLTRDQSFNHLDHLDHQSSSWNEVLLTEHKLLSFLKCK